MGRTKNKNSGMRFSLQLSNLHIRTKLITIIALIIAFFSLITLTVVLSFHRIEGVLGDVIAGDVQNVMNNALTERELSSIVADLGLLVGTFFENDDNLNSEGQRLLEHMDILSRRCEDSELKTSLDLFIHSIESLLEQCRKVNSHLVLLHGTDHEIVSGLDRLDEVIADQLIEATLGGNDTGILQQLAVLVVGYRQSILVIGKQHAERWPETYFKPLDLEGDPLLQAIDEVDFRLRTLIAGDPPIVDLGRLVIKHLQAYKNGILDLNTVMVELKQRMVTVEESKSRATEILKKSDRDVMKAISAANTKVVHTIQTTEMSLLLVSLLLVATLVVLTIIFFENIIKKPMAGIREGIEAFRLGDFETRIDLVRDDEWCLIENALNDMAAQLATTYVELDKAKRFVSNIIDSMPSVLVGVDKQGNITQWNLQAEKVTGLPSDNVLSRPLDNMFPGLAGQMSNIEDAINTKQVIHTPKVAHLVKDKKRYEDITIYPLIANGVEGAVIRVDDVTREKNMEDELNATRKLEAIGLLAGGVAHDFNNMLAAIMSATELLGHYLPDESEQPKARKMHRMILDAATRAADLTKQLLAFSRQADKVSTVIKVHDIIKETVIILKSSLDRRISIEVNLAASHDNIVGDPSLLQNSLLNLCINAGHAMTEGGFLRISTDDAEIDELFCNSSSFDLSPGPFIELEVRDSGCGIPQENLVRIFDPFFTTKEKGKGTGLGLSTVYGTIQQHNGSITVYSEIGRGTVFKILLPTSSRTWYGTGEESQAPRGSGCILIVDDEDIMRFTAKEILEKYGYTILLAENGAEAVEVFRREHAVIDLVLLDMIMPVMNGRDCFKQLKKIDPAVKVVLSSGFSREDDFQEMVEDGLSGFIRKPYLTSTLCQKIYNALQ